MAERKKTSKGVVKKAAAGPVRKRTVEAESFRLLDKAGRVRAVLEVTRQGPRLSMLHENGAAGLDITLTADGAGIRLGDGIGDTRVFAGAMRGASRVGMADARGVQRLFLGLNGAGEPVLTLYDAAQQQTWTTRSKGKVKRVAKGGG